jgi:tetratricopeptide (TPR) repeat protein
MAKKVTRREAARATREPPTQRSGETERTRPRWLLLGCVALLMVSAAVGVIVWRQHAIVTRIQAALPARPELAGRPAILAESLARSEQKTKSSDTALEGVTELGRLYHANGFTSEAEACWQFLRHEQPAEPRWNYYLADVNRSRSDYPAMSACLEQTLAIDPRYAPARLQLASLQFKSGDLENAERNYQRVVEDSSKNPHARLGLIRVALQANRKDEARSRLEGLLKDNPHFSTAHNLYAELLAAAGDAAGSSKHRWLGRETLRYREAKDPWMDELQRWCYDYDRLCVLGTVEFQSDQHDRAQSYFDRAIAIEPGKPQAYELLSSVHFKRNEVERARDLLEGALPRLTDRTSPRFFISLSLAYRLLQRPDEAIRVVQTGLEHAGPQSELLGELGMALADAGKHKEAVAVWQDALAKNPGDANTNYNLARSFLALRQLDEALDALDRSLTLQPTFVPTLLLRGQIELEAAHLELAERYLRPAFESHPEEPQARRLFAEWHLRMGTAAESKGDTHADRYYQTGLSIDDQHSPLLLRLGAFYVARERFTDALPSLVSYHQLQPEDASGCLVLGQALAATGQRDEARTILTKGAELAERTGNVSVGRQCRRMLQQL